MMRKVTRMMKRMTRMTAHTRRMILFRLSLWWLHCFEDITTFSLAQLKEKMFEYVCVCVGERLREKEPRGVCEEGGSNVNE